MLTHFTSKLEDFQVRGLSTSTLLRWAREAWELLGYIPYAISGELHKRGYSAPDLELQFSLGAQT